MKHLLHLTLALLLAIAPGLHCQTAKARLPRARVVSTSMILNHPPFEQCHASTLAELSDGSVMAAFFGGAFEGNSDVKIWAVKQKGEKWTTPVVLADGRINDTLYFPCWNPVLFKTSAGRLYLFYKLGKNPREWFGMMKFSEDDGQTWSEPVKLPDGVLGPIKNKPVELSDGKLLCPSSTETTEEWKVQMELFDPATLQWSIIPVDQSNPVQVIQPTILRHNDSTFRILCRSKSNLVITSLSVNSGLNWSRLKPISLPNPNSGIDGISLRNGSHLLVYNPLVSGREWVEGRNKLNLAWSPDGINWQDLLVLERQKTGEFSYPAIIQTADNRIHITYTYNRVQVRHRVIRLKNHPYFNF